MGNILNYSIEPNVTEDPHTDAWTRWVSELMWVRGRFEDIYCHFWRWKKEPQAKECRKPLEGGKVRKIGSPCLSEKNIALPTTWFYSSETNFGLLISRTVK